MPFPQRIASQRISIVVPSPAAKRQKIDEAGSAGTDLDVRGFRVLSSSLRGAADFERDSPLAVDDGRYQDVFDQWGALFKRERHEAYASARGDLPTASASAVREKACHWCYSIVDHWDVSRSTVSAAMSYFDGLVANGYVERSEWSLALVASLHLSVKINSYGGRVFDPKHLAELCGQESVTGEAIVEMEDHICNVFDWHVNPPVPNAYVDILAPLLAYAPLGKHDFDVQGDAAFDGMVRHKLTEEARFLCERSVIDSFLASRAPSSTAYASIVVAMELMRFPTDVIQHIASLSLDHSTEETELCIARLRELCEKEDHAPTIDFWVGRETVSEESLRASPRTVTPTKGDAPSVTKRIRQESIVDSICGGNRDEEETILSDTKRRRIC